MRGLSATWTNLRTWQSEFDGDDDGDGGDGGGDGGGGDGGEGGEGDGEDTLF